MAKAPTAETTGLRKTPSKVLQVSFDLWNTVSGDARYKLADAALELHGEVFKPIKQMRFLITTKSSDRILQSLVQRIGRNTSIFITELRNVRQIRISDPDKQAEWDRFEAALGDAGIELVGLPH